MLKIFKNYKNYSSKNCQDCPTPVIAQSDLMKEGPRVVCSEDDIDAASGELTAQAHPHFSGECTSK